MVIRRSLLWLVLLCGTALAQSNPNFVKGQVPTAAQWNSYFTSKTDTTNGTLVNPSISGASQLTGTVSGTPDFLGNVTFSGAAIFGAGGTLSGTFGGNPTLTGTWSGGTQTGANVSGNNVTSLGLTLTQAQWAANATTVYAAGYGVVADRVDVTADLNVSATSTAATTTTTTFTAQDVGKIIMITGAGTGGIALLTTISAFVGPHAVTLADAAVTTVTNANFSYGSNIASKINDAITAARTRYPAGARVELPAGKYIINPALQRVDLLSYIDLEGPGKGTVDIRCATLVNSTNYNLNACIFGNALTNITVRGLIVKGMGDVVPTRQSNDFGSPIYLVGSTNVEMSDLQISYTRTYALEISSSTNVTFRNNWLSYSYSASIGCGGCLGDVIAIGNHIDHCADAVAFSTGDSASAPGGMRSLIFNDNSLTESVGVEIAGARSTTVNGNTFIRAITHAVWVMPWTSFNAGDTPTTAVNVTGNSVQDVINRTPGSALTDIEAYIVLGGGQRQAGSGTSVPGYPTSGTGTVTDLYGTNTTGNFFAPNTLTSTVPSPGSIGWNVSNNILVRTLPAVTTYSQWGYGTIFWGTYPNVGTYTGAIAEADLELPCINVRMPLRLSSIHDNKCATTGDYGINFMATAPAIGDYDQLRIHNNLFYDFNVAGINFATSSDSSSQIDILDNSFNGDPRFRNAARGAGGTWASNALMGILDGHVSGLRINGNSYRNLGQPFFLGSNTVWIGPDETLYGTPVADGFSTSNVGVGKVNGITGFNGVFKQVCEDDDPTSATFGQITANTGLSQASEPVSGCWLRGTFVSIILPGVDSNGRTLLGWIRLTTGSGNVDGTDWQASYRLPTTGQTVVGTTIVTSSPYTVLSTDMGKFFQYNSAGAIAVTLPQAGTTGFEHFKCFFLINLGAGTVTITPTTSLINGAASMAYATNAGGTVCSDGINYFAW